MAEWNLRIPKDHMTEVVKRSGIKCELCSIDLRRRPYHIHHLNGDPACTIPDNLLLICPECFTEIYQK